MIATLLVVLAACGTPDLTNETVGGATTAPRGPDPCGGAETPPLATLPSTTDPVSPGSTRTADPNPTTDTTGPITDPDPTTGATSPGTGVAATGPGEAPDPGAIAGTAPTASPDARDPAAANPTDPARGTRPPPIERGSTPGTLPCTPAGDPPGATVTGTTPVTGTALPSSGPAGPTADYAGAANTLTLGGPGATVGNEVIDRDCPQFQPTAQPPCGPQPGFWTAINGPFSPYVNGDPSSTRCGLQAPKSSTGPSTGSPTGPSCSPTNPHYREAGYAYAIDVAPGDVGRPLSVDAFDLGTFTRSIGKASPGTSHLDCNWGAAPFAAMPGAPPTGVPNGFSESNCQTGDTGTAQNVDLEVFDVGGTDGTIRFDRTLPSCHLTMTASDLSEQAATFKNNWVRVCTFTPRQVGVYAIRVRNSGLPGLPDIGDGTNAFALRVAGATATRLYPVGDQSVWMNMPGSSPTLPLARLPERFAGRRLVIDAFDPGDGTGPNQFTVTVKPPRSAEPYHGDAGRLSCSYNATPSTDRAPATPDHADGCTIVTKQPNSGSSLYNGKWLRIVVDLDPAYRCPTDCYWTLSYDFGSSFPMDRVMWSAAIE